MVKQSSLSRDVALCGIPLVLLDINILGNVELLQISRSKIWVIIT